MCRRQGRGTITTPNVPSLFTAKLRALNAMFDAKRHPHLEAFGDGATSSRNVGMDSEGLGDGMGCAAGYGVGYGLGIGLSGLAGMGREGPPAPPPEGQSA